MKSVLHIAITGATKGIGRAIAESLASEGHALYLCSRSATDLDNAQKALESISVKAGHPPHIFIKTCDVRDRDSLLAYGRWCLEKSQERIDVLINNAGIFLPGSVLEEEAGRLEQMIETNIYSAYYLSRFIGKTMVKNSRGHIINMCSIASEMAYPNGGSYSISKFAMLGMGKVLREELKPHGVKVTNILPGATWSDSWAGVDLPESRLMKADDIAKVVNMSISLSTSAVVEDITIRPQLGDL